MHTNCGGQLILKEMSPIKEYGTQWKPNWGKFKGHISRKDLIDGSLYNSLKYGPRKMPL